MPHINFRRRGRVAVHPPLCSLGARTVTDPKKVVGLAVVLLGASVVRAQPSAPPAADAPTASASFLRIDIQKDCGAKGDGTTNDTAAFQKAATVIQKARGGILVIPQATYIVGQQTHDPGTYPYYQPQPIFEVRQLDRLVIEGNGAVIRLAPGLRFGSFDKETGQPYLPRSMPFLDLAYHTPVGSMFGVTGSRNVEIRDLELDGNLSALVIGGQFGDTGRQLEAYGLRLLNNTDVTVQQVHSHHHALDGITIGWYGLQESDPATPHTLVDCRFEYNGRQGLSWIGGRGIRACRCKFSHTQRGTNQGEPFGSAPGAGLDIEAEDSICRDGHFEDCEFINNGGCGMVADSGDGGYTQFTRCLFWGTTAWSAWSAKPGLKYEDCVFHGSIVHAIGSPDVDLATRWTRCTFEDEPWTDGQRPYGGFLVEINGDMQNVTFDACRLTANACPSVWCSGTGVRFSDCTVIHRASSIRAGDFQCLMQGSALRGCHFQEAFPPEETSNWYIAVEGSHVLAGSPTTVDGPRVHWGHPEGPVGEIRPEP